MANVRGPGEIVFYLCTKRAGVVGQAARIALPRFSHSTDPEEIL
jgi:hypothetical protein